MRLASVGAYQCSGGGACSWFAFVVGAVARLVLVLDCAVNVDNYVLATWQMHVARNCTCLSFEVTNY